jgi:hypothetical protein
MARTRDSIMKDLRNTQKQLLMAKSHRNSEKAGYCRARMMELQKEYDGVNNA